MKALKAICLSHQMIYKKYVWLLRLRQKIQTVNVILYAEIMKTIVRSQYNESSAYTLSEMQGEDRKLCTSDNEVRKSACLLQAVQGNIYFEQHIRA